MKKLLYLSIVLNLFLIITVGTYVINKNGIKFIKSYFKKSSITSNRIFLAQKSLFDIYPSDSSNILFVGNSIIRNCEWNEFLSNPKIRNRGIDGIGMKDILNEMNSIILSKAKKTFILSGTNELQNLQNVDEILTEYRQLISRLKYKTELHILSCPPINNQISENNIRNNDIIELNKKLEYICLENSIKYIDINTPLLDSDCQLNKSYTFDGVHLNAKGYSAISDIISRYIN